MFSSFSFRYHFFISYFLLRDLGFILSPNLFLLLISSIIIIFIVATSVSRGINFWTDLIKVINGSSSEWPRIDYFIFCTISVAHFTFFLFVRIFISITRTIRTYLAFIHFYYSLLSYVEYRTTLGS